MPVFTLASKNKASKPSNATPKPKVSRRPSLKKLAGVLRRKLSTDKGKGLVSAKDIQSVVEQRILEENDENRAPCAEPESYDDAELRSDFEQHDENIVNAPLPCPASEITCKDLSIHEEPRLEQPQATDEPTANENKDVPQETSTPDSISRTPDAFSEEPSPPPYERPSVRLVSSGKSSSPRSCSPLATHPPHAHWLSSQPPYAFDDAHAAPTLRGCAPFRLSLV